MFYCWLNTNEFGAVSCSPQAAWNGELTCIWFCSFGFSKTRFSSNTVVSAPAIWGLNTVGVGVVSETLWEGEIYKEAGGKPKRNRQGKGIGKIWRNNSNKRLWQNKLQDGVPWINIHKPCCWEQPGCCQDTLWKYLMSISELRDTNIPNLDLNPQIRIGVLDPLLEQEQSWNHLTSPGNT